MQVSLSKAVYMFAKGLSVAIEDSEGVKVTWNKREGFKSLYRVLLPYYYANGDKQLKFHLGFSVPLCKFNN